MTRLRTQMHGAIFAWLLALAPHANAVPMLSVDTDPSTAGIQAMRSVNEGDVFEIDLLITDVESSDPLHAYELDLGFDPSVIGALSLTPGPFLAAPTFELESAIAADAVMYAVTRIGTAGVEGEGLLLTVQFVARGVGMSVLDLSNVLLSAPNGRPILDFVVADGSIIVAPIPEPGSMLLLLCSAAVALATVWRTDASR